ncbi:MAG: hypothetical protein ABI949_12295 [Ilumatobacteraceae bacterium]
MNPPSILLDHSFLTAVADSSDANHDEAVAVYQRLIDEFVDDKCLLVARVDQLAAIDHRELFTSVDKVHIARQHRNAAAELAGRTEIDPDLALTLVLIHRLRFRSVATFDTRLVSYDVGVITSISPTFVPSSAPRNFVAAESSGDQAATDFSIEGGQVSN